VYCYATRDTVESRILSQGVRNGSSIYLREDDVESKIVDENMPNVVGAAQKGGDVGNDGKEEELLQLIL
jgi:E3 ubiquitin-protein ligase SHPRH